MIKPVHILVLIIVLLLIFGASKLPDIAKSFGQSAKVLKKEMKELQEDTPPATPTQPVQGQAYPQQPYPPQGQYPQGQYPPGQTYPVQDPNFQQQPPVQNPLPPTTPENGNSNQS